MRLWTAVREKGHDGLYAERARQFGRVKLTAMVLTTLKEKWCYIVGGVIAVLLFGGIGWGLLQQRLYEHQSLRGHTDYSTYSADRIRQVCLEFPAAQQPTCFRKGANEQRMTSRDNMRDYENLAAQQTSALWTKIMGLAALLGMGLSALGIWLVKTTFDETRRGNEILLHGAGASLFVESGRYSIAENLITIELVVVNNGASTAHGVQAAIEMTVTATAKRVFNEFEGLLNERKQVLKRNLNSSMSDVPAGCRETNIAFFVDQNKPESPISETIKAFRLGIPFAARIEFDARLTWENHLGQARGIGVHFVTSKAENLTVPLANMIHFEGQLDPISHSKIEVN